MGAYKSISCSASLAACITDGVSRLQTLGSECRDIVDSAEGGLAETQRIQSLGETADALEGLNEPDMPAELDTVGALPITYFESHPTRKGRCASREVQCANACSMLAAAVDMLASQDEETHEGAADLASEVQEIIDTAEGCEFPGMYG